MYENDIKKDAYYLINKFKKDDKEVTNMQIQKLMYFTEAYYMNLTNAEELYNCNFNAWAFGPVSIPLYKEFRNFGKNPITLTEEQEKQGKEISQDKKTLLNYIYEIFGNLSGIQLMKLTHIPNSPWSNVWERNGNKVSYGANTYIDKIETRDWFRREFIE